MSHAYTRTDGDGNEVYAFDFPDLANFGGGKMVDPDKMEQLAIMQALYKVVGAAVGTKDPDNLRGQVDETLMDSYFETGAKSFDLRVNGEKVGTASVKVQKGYKTQTLQIEDYDAYEKWLDGEGSDYRDILVQQYGEKILSLAMADGVLPDGCAVVNLSTSDKVVGTTIRVDPQKVYEAAGPMLDSVVHKALTGEVE